MKIRRFMTGMLATAVISVTMLPVTASADEWKKTEKGYVYEYDNGTKAEKGWLKLDGKYYYIQKNGTRKTGWLNTTSGKYYFDKNGVMYRSKWLTMKSGTKYYIKSDGKAATGLVKLSGVTYKFDDEGKYLGENHRFILNKKSMCLHSTNCMAAKKIKKENYATINIGSEEFDEKNNEGYWACGVDGCNPLAIELALPKNKD